MLHVSVPRKHARGFDGETQRHREIKIKSLCVSALPRQSPGSSVRQFGSSAISCRVLLRENVPLAPLTTLGVGGPARYFAEAANAHDVRAAVHEALARNLRLFVLGGGSNLVIADDGWPGLVLKIAIRGIDTRRENGNVIFEAGAGEEWDALVAAAVKQDCAGVECLSGIPGTVGGTP